MENTETKKKIGYRDIVHQKEYMKMCIAGMINRFGDSIDAVAYTWIVYEITNSASWSAIIYALNLLPTIFITAFAGAWVENREKKPIMVLTDLARAVCVAFIATAYLLGFLQPWMLAVTTLFISTVEAFRVPAGTAITPQVLDKEYYDYGIAFSSTLSQTALIAGTAAAAAIIALIGSAGAIYIDMATFILSAVLIMSMKVKEGRTEKEQQMAEEKESYWSSFTSGIKYLIKSKVIMLLMGIVVILNAFTAPMNSLEAPMASEIFGGGVEILSIISIATMVGSIAGAVIYPKAKELLSGRILSFLTGICMGIFYLGMIIAQPLYGSKVFMYSYAFLLGGILGMVVALMSSYCYAQMLSRTDEIYLARVSSVLQSLSMAVSPIIALIISVVVKLTDIAVIFTIVGVISVVASIPMLFVKTLDAPPPKEDKAAAT